MPRRNLVACGRRPVSKIEAEKADSFLRPWPVTAESYAQCAIAIAGSVRPSEAADKISAPDVTSKTEFKRVISNTLLTSFVTFTSLKWIPFD